MSTINRQTAGPLTEQAGILVGADTRTIVGEGCGPAGLIRGPERRANAALLAASYTSYDKAGRELGVDATKLAESVDLAALIRTARDMLADADDQATFYRIRFHDLLAKLPKEARA